MNALTGLVNWYHSQCNGDWEHSYGVKISTLDNPGWMVDIALEGTDLEEREFTTVDIERTEHDWLWCVVKEGKFSIRCGPLNLEEGIEQFLKWVDLDKTRKHKSL